MRANAPACMPIAWHPHAAGAQPRPRVSVRNSLEFRPRMTIEMIAASVVALRESDQLAANPRRTGEARQLTQPAGHLAAMIAFGRRGSRFAPCRQCQIGGSQKPAGGANKTINPIPARVVTNNLVIHTRPINLRYCRMRPIITANTPKDRDVNVLKRCEFVVNNAMLPGRRGDAGLTHLLSTAALAIRLSLRFGPISCVEHPQPCVPDPIVKPVERAPDKTAEDAHRPLPALRVGTSRHAR
jgi:hypothetical protein